MWLTLHDISDSWYTLTMSKEEKKPQKKPQMNKSLTIILAVSVFCLIGIIVYASNWEMVAATNWSERIGERLDLLSGWVQVQEEQKAAAGEDPADWPVYTADIAYMSRSFPAIMKIADADGDYLDVPLISQSDVGYQTGCELVSAAMVLQFYGMEITPADIYEVIDKRSKYMVNDRYGIHPNEFFIGDPRSAQAFGCYVSPLTRAMNRLVDESLLAVNVTGSDLSFLTDTYIKNDIPVVIWATINMSEPKDGASWQLENGSTFTWIAGEHCLVLVGEDSDYYYFNDPNHAGEVVGYEKAIVEERYEALGKQAMILSR